MALAPASSVSIILATVTAIHLLACNLFHATTTHCDRIPLLMAVPAAFRTIDSPQHLLRVPNNNMSRPNSDLLGQKDPTQRCSMLPLATNGVANALARSSPAGSGDVWSPYIGVWSTRRKSRAIYRFESRCQTCSNVLPYSFDVKILSAMPGSKVPTLIGVVPLFDLFGFLRGHRHELARHRDSICIFLLAFVFLRVAMSPHYLPRI